jgi:hypothetical protein
MDFLSKELLHQYLAITEARLLHTFFVKRKHIMLKVGIDCMTTFRRISRAAHAKCFSDQPCILLPDLSPIWSNVQLVTLPTAVGSPR